MAISCDVSVIIVNYNTKELVKNCLTSVFVHTSGINFEVIVSDNGSSDGSVKMIKESFPQVVLVENGMNIGFGAANNRGLQVAKGKYIFYLNSDTVLLNNAIKIFFDYWENATNKDCIGALGGVLLNDKLQETHSSGYFPNYRLIFRSLFLSFLDSIGLKKKIKEFLNIKIFQKKGCVDYITGADLLSQTSSFK